MSLPNLSEILRQERQLVDSAEPGTSERFNLQLMELERAMVVDGIVRELDLDHGVTLLDLAAHAPEPWPDVLEDLHASLVSADLEVLPRSLVDFLR